MAKNNTRAGDYTGVQKEKDIQAHQAELKIKSREMSLLNSLQAEEDDSVVDLTGDEQLENQTRKFLAENHLKDGLVGFEEQDAQDIPGRPSSAHAKGTTGHPGQGLPGQGALQADGTMKIGQEVIKTNSTSTTGTGWETPGTVLGSTGASQVTRNRVDTVGDSINATRNYGIKGLSEVEEVGGPVNSDEVPVVVRVKETIEHVTIGVGTDYSFQEGRQYRVPKRVADHLEEKNLVWH